MVAVTDAEVSLAGKCVQVNYHRQSLSTANAVTIYSYCVAANTLDD